MTLVKFANPAQRNGLSPLFSDVFESVFNDSFVSDRLVSKIPAVNIAESEDEYHIELAAPGLKKEDFKVNLDKNVISISVERSSENTEDAKKYNRREYSYTSFVRSFTLPEAADQNNISAEYTDGVLKINVGKREEAKNVTREISIK
ncbi:MAG: Hsp20/alpha crystallin family protein [Sphingobacteriaceae bacterium]|jgi:HSP20 family protein|nr:Hsp20/alpha crystallin family protein [Sphingobacteriaceae bacterium]